jgi:transposase-like protein
MKELEETIPLLYLHGLSTRRVKKAVGKFLGKRGLSHQNVIRISNKIVNEFYAPSYEHALEGIELFKKDWGKKYPSALECLVDDIKLCLTYYNYPYTHRKRIRTTNAAERSFREVKRRTKIIGRFQDETRALTMVWWQLKELTWYGMAMSHEAKAILGNIRASKYAKAA